MSSWVKIWRVSIIIVIFIPKIRADHGYLKYPSPIDRSCLPYINCPPGHEILPCTTQFGYDVCQPCAEGLIQLKNITSTGNTNDTLCFEPIGECIAQDITYRRHPKDSFCEDMKGCMCDVSLCYYGDPCLCKVKDGCGIGEELNETTGECMECPEGTEKNDTGCGPCQRFKYVPSRQESITVKKNSVTPKPIPTTGTSVPYMMTKDNRESNVELKGATTASIYENMKKRPNPILIVMISVLGLAVIALLLGVLVLLKRKPGCVMLGVCFSNNIHNNDNIEAQRMVPVEVQNERELYTRDDQVVQERKSPRLLDDSVEPFGSQSTHRTDNENNKSQTMSEKRGGASFVGQNENCSNDDYDENRKLVEDIKKSIPPGTFNAITRLSSQLSFPGQSDIESDIVDIRSTNPSSDYHSNCNQNTCQDSCEEASGSYLTMHVPESRMIRIVDDSHNLEKVLPHQYNICTEGQRIQHTKVKNNAPDSWSSTGGDSGIHNT